MTGRRISPRDFRADLPQFSDALLSFDGQETASSMWIFEVFHRQPILLAIKTDVGEINRGKAIISNLQEREITRQLYMKECICTLNTGFL